MLVSKVLDANAEHANSYFTLTKHLIKDREISVQFRKSIRVSVKFGTLSKRPRACVKFHILLSIHCESVQRLSTPIFHQFSKSIIPLNKEQ